MEMPDVIYAHTDNSWFVPKNPIATLAYKYHHDRILKAKDARIAELEAYIESRGYQAP